MGKLLQSRSYPPSIKMASSNVSKVYAGTTQVWPVTGYYDCGYGCQYYESPPACTDCLPTVTNVLTSLFINDISNSGLNYYVSLTNNYSSTTKNYKLKFTSDRTGSTTVQSVTLSVIGYPYDSTSQVDLFFSGTTESMTMGNIVGDTITIELSEDNGSTWTAPITPTSVVLNYDPAPPAP